MHVGFVHGVGPGQIKRPVEVSPSQQCLQPVAWHRLLSEVEPHFAGGCVAVYQGREATNARGGGGSANRIGSNVILSRGCYRKAAMPTMHILRPNYVPGLPHLKSKHQMAPAR